MLLRKMYLSYFFRNTENTEIFHLVACQRQPTYCKRLPYEMYPSISLILNLCYFKCFNSKDLPKRICFLGRSLHACMIAILQIKRGWHICVGILIVKQRDIMKLASSNVLTPFKLVYMEQKKSLQQNIRRYIYIIYILVLQV